MSFETISLNTDYRGVSTLSLNRPEKHNAMSGQMIDELALAADQLTKDNQTRVVVLTGAGESFCAGGDLEWMRIQFDADRHGRISEATKLAKMLFALNTIPKPLIGRIQGSAYGGGVGLMCVCDVVIGVDSAKFGLTETRLGLIRSLCQTMWLLWLQNMHWGLKDCRTQRVGWMLPDPVILSMFSQALQFGALRFGDKTLSWAVHNIVCKFAVMAPSGNVR